MNAVEIEEAVSKLAGEPFDPANFPFKFLEAFGNKETTIRKLRSGNSNASDVAGGILQRNNIHIAVTETGRVSAKLQELRDSPKTATAKAKFVLATDGEMLEAEDLASGEAVACRYTDFANHFGLFLTLAGITTVREIQNNPIDIRATGRLNKLYLELLKENPEWEKAERRHDLNQFMAQLIFCLFAEDTGIFRSNSLFTKTVQQMSDASNTHEVIAALFRAMDCKIEERPAKDIKPWADVFPYVNGGLFTGTRDVPRFSKMARAYLLQAGSLDWKLINPDIFGSMIQAVADDDERGELGMHYTSVPNILKVLNPLFLDDLRDELERAGDNPRKLNQLRRRLTTVRVFDPACGSGNFLVIAYKQMREIEAEINHRQREGDRPSDIPLTNFRGIELRDFAAEVARLALIIAEYQCDVLYRGEKLALAEFLPLNAMNWITCGNALRLDWLSVCPPTMKAVKFAADDLFQTPLDQAQIDFENAGGETYICGNPPYLGYNKQSVEQKEDLQRTFIGKTRNWRSLDYISGWFGKYAEIAEKGYVAAFVTTNSLCQGEHCSILWPVLFKSGINIFFAVPDFRWSNSAANNAGVTVSVIGLTSGNVREKFIYRDNHRRKVASINQYLIEGNPVPIASANRSVSGLQQMLLGNMPKDGGNLILSRDEAHALEQNFEEARDFIYGFYGSQELINGVGRYCLWISDDEAEKSASIPPIAERLAGVAEMRRKSPAKSTQDFGDRPHRFKQIQGLARFQAISIPSVSSERRDYLPVDLLPPRNIVSSLAFAIYDAPLWNLALVASRIHLVWIATVCGKLETRYRYSNTLGWNTFPLPTLTEKMKSDLTRCAEDILLAREDHWPANIADLYDPDNMPEDLRLAHERNDETLERIYIGRRFRNDTERLEKLFDLYTKMTAEKGRGETGKLKKKSHAMTEFSTFTIVAACTVISDFVPHSELALLEVEWGIPDRCSVSSKSARAADLAKIVLSEQIEVLTEKGKMPLPRAVVEKAILAPPIKQDSVSWQKLIAGLRFDGFEIKHLDIEVEPSQPWEPRVIRTESVLRRMYPEDVPSLDFKEAENEVSRLLKKHDFQVSDGHLKQAIDSFSRGFWASANAQLRAFFESYQKEIAKHLGYTGDGDAKAVRKFLGEIDPPFLFRDYNEWHANEQKPQFFQGLMSRMHPEGSHPGLSDEDDCTFRFHIMLVTARLIMRRFDRRKS